jgi:drug/metabolite transporter (DMT)-like permease
VPIGIALQLAALVLFVAMDTLFKLLTDRYAVVQLAWARFVFSSLTVWAFFAITTQGRLPWRSRAPAMQATRSLVLAGCTFFFASALVFLPLADTTAVNFAAPLLTVALAAVILREHVSARRWVGVVIGLAGVMVAVRPPFLTGEAIAHPAYFLPLGSAALFAVYQILTRRLAALDDARTTILHTGVAAAVLCTVLLPFFWVTPTLADWGLLVAIGALGGVSHGILVLAYARAPVSLLAPLSYTQLLWAGLAGWLVFADMPDRWTLLGAGVILAGGLLTLWPARQAPSGAPRN